MDKQKEEVGKRIAEVRKAKKIKQEELKELIGAPTVQMISGWENGHSFPSVTYLIKIAKKLDTSLDYLLLGIEQNEKDTSIKNYKQAATYIVELVNSGLFRTDERYSRSGTFGEKSCHEIMLLSENNTIADFKHELDNLLIASKTLKPELYRQAILDLLDKYNRPIKK